MATNTTKLALSKPDGTDLVDVAVLNGNFDKIDAASGATICTSSTRPASPWNGQVIFETDTLNALVYRAATTSWAILGGSTVASDPPAGAGNGNFWWDSDNGKLYIYYQDGNSGQWVSVMPAQTAVDVTQNFIINGDFAINQRNFSSTTTFSAYGFDRWQMFFNTGTTTYSAQTFTVGSGPASGIEASNYARIVTSGQSGSGAYTQFDQKIEDVRALAGKTVTVSFYARAGSGTPKVAIELDQNFGSGGSPSSSERVYAGQVTLSTSWQRYSVTATLPSLTGKTIGTNANSSFTQLNFWTSAGTDFNARTGSLGIQSNTFDFWGVQVEVGSVATAFRRNANSIQGELAACQRYYWRTVSTDLYGTFGIGIASASNEATLMVPNPVAMRVPATAIESSALAVWDSVTVIGTTSVTLRTGHQTTTSTPVRINVAGNPLPQYRPYYLLNGNNVSAFLGVSAEL